MENTQEMRDSVVPDVRFLRKGVTINWPALSIIVFGLLGVGGGGFTIVTNDTSTKNVAKAIEVQVDTKVENKLNVHKLEHIELNKQIGVIIAKIDSVISNQNWQKAEKAANRVCSKLPKWRGDKCFRRLLQENVERLNSKEPRPVCADVDCTN